MYEWTYEDTKKCHEFDNGWCHYAHLLCQTDSEGYFHCGAKLRKEIQSTDEDTKE